MIDIIMISSHNSARQYNIETLSDFFSREGLTILGTVRSDEFPDMEKKYLRQFENGYHGSMDYLIRHSRFKYAPSLLLPGSRTILLTGINYNQVLPGTFPTGQGRISRYAIGRDYHNVLSGKLRNVAKKLRDLFPSDRFQYFCDSSPLDERFYAGRAGLGIIGKNTLLITRKYGSWIVLGGIISTRDSSVKSPAWKVRSCPPACTRCIDACPTGALRAPYKLNASRCLSYLTIEFKGIIPVKLRPMLKNRLFGCDACQEACPFNRNKPVTDQDDFLHPIAGPSLSLEEIITIRDDASYEARFRGSPLMRIKRSGLIRNACIVSGNNRVKELVPILSEISRCPASGDNAIIREHARWAIDRIEQPKEALYDPV